MTDIPKTLEAIKIRLEHINQWDRSLNVNRVPIEKILLYVLDLYKSGTFRGEVRLNIKDTEIYNPVVSETPQLNREYIYLDLPE